LGRKKPHHDDLIIKLLGEGRIAVREDADDPVLDSTSAEMRPRNKIFLRDARNGAWRLQTMHPNIGNHPYFSIYPEGRRGGMVWLSARRAVWYAFHPERTFLMVCPIDGDPWNYNIWNLCLRDQNDENYIRLLNQQRSHLERGGNEEDWPF
jgi:hypothetical protein